MRKKRLKRAARPQRTQVRPHFRRSRELSLLLILHARLLLFFGYRFLLCWLESEPCAPLAQSARIAHNRRKEASQCQSDCVAGRLKKTASHQQPKAVVKVTASMSRAELAAHLPVPVVRKMASKRHG